MGVLEGLVDNREDLFGTMDAVTDFGSRLPLCVGVKTGVDPCDLMVDHHPNFGNTGRG